MSAKYLILRRDGSVPEWPAFVLGASDPAAYGALVAYRKDAERRGYDPAYLALLDERILAFTDWTAKSVPNVVAYEVSNEVPDLAEPGRSEASKDDAHARNLVAHLFAGHPLARLVALSRRALARG